MNIILNGQSHQVPAHLTVSALLQSQGLAERRVAVEINGHIVPRSQHVDHQVCDGDRIEIVHAFGGG